MDWFLVGMIRVAALALGLAFISVEASAQQRPAAWDTRVRTDSSAAPAPEVKAPQEKTVQPDVQKKARKKQDAVVDAPK